MAGPQNKSVTIDGSSAVVSVVTLTKRADGEVIADVYGSASASDGTTLSNSVRYQLPANQKTAVLNYMNGGALTRWREANGLEAP